MMLDVPFGTSSGAIAVHPAEWARVRDNSERAVAAKLCFEAGAAFASITIEHGCRTVRICHIREGGTRDDWGGLCLAVMTDVLRPAAAPCRIQ
eukprot:7145995-Prymnesium_polylepis.1